MEAERRVRRRRILDVSREDCAFTHDETPRCLMIEEFEVLFGILPEAGIKLGVAVLCGILLGMEREQKGKPAGLRTITLITVGSTLFMIVSDLVTLMTDGPEAITRVDPSRIASQVVTGVGFLGAGAIIQSRGSIHGLTTAATIWVAAGIGLCIGVGFPALATGITLLVLAVLVTLDPLRTRLSQRGDTTTLDLETLNDSLVIERIKNILGSHDLPESNLSIEQQNGDRLVLQIQLNKEESGNQRLMDELATIEGVTGTPIDKRTA